MEGGEAGTSSTFPSEPGCLRDWDWDCAARRSQHTALVGAQPAKADGLLDGRFAVMRTGRFLSSALMATFWKKMLRLSFIEIQLGLGLHILSNCC